MVINSGEPTGSAAPVSLPQQGGAGSSSEARTWRCEFAGCDQVFKTKTGRGVHHQKAHKDWYDANQPKKQLKARWNSEETALLARQEARLLMQGSKFINQDLTRFFPNRTLESIKGQRRKAEHKNLVTRLLQELSTAQDEHPPESMVAQPGPNTPSSASAPVPAPTEHIEEDPEVMVIDYLESLAHISTDKFGANRLDTICRSVRHWSADRIRQEITLYLLEIFPITPRKERVIKGSDQPDPRITKRRARRTEYALTQKMWRKNRSNCLRTLLRDKQTTDYPPEGVMTPFWERLMTSECETSPGAGSPKKTYDELWFPITPLEISKALPPAGTAPGPDGLSARDLREVPADILTRVFNIIMLGRMLPKHLLESRTILIPKKDNADQPSDFRPITVSSVLARTLHKVLANRMSRLIPLDSRQKAFRPIDGCAENIFLLDFVLSYCRQRFKSIYIASLDVMKAFDSVSHQAIRDTLRDAGVPARMVGYIMNSYGESVTKLKGKDWTSRPIRPGRGVKQGDPLSPMIFNLIINRLFAMLPEEVGLKIGETKLNAMGFADDLILMATTPMGLQSMLDTSAGYLQKCGLVVNASKCFTVSVRALAKSKKTVIDADQVFTCLGQEIPALRRSEEWKYLGVPFTPEGRVMGRPLENLRHDLDKLTRAPLKPQQRLFALRTVVLPGLYHLLALGRTNLSLLNKIDAVMRLYVRRWLALPHDTPNAYFHADAKDGGLSLPTMRWCIPLQRLNRLKRLQVVEMAEIPATIKAFLDLEIKRAENRLQDQGQIINTKSEYRKRLAQLLYKSNDGRPLLRSGEVTNQHRWVTDGTAFVSGKDFLRMLKLRINAVPLRARTARGRLRDRHCRAGCLEAETLHHVLQICHRTHEPRIKRHDACIHYVCKHLGQDFAVHKEPEFRTPNGILKPDVVLVKDNTAIVLDAQVVGDYANIDLAHQAKISKYKVLKDQVKNRYSSDRVIFTSLTLTARGIWCRKSFEHLVELNLIKREAAKILSTRVLIGGLYSINIFEKSTRTRRGNGRG